MKKNLLLPVATALLLGAGSLTTNAQTVYGLANNSWWTDDYYSGLSTASIDVSTLNAETENALTLGEAKLINYDIKAGTSVGNKYYAVMEYYDEAGTQNTDIDLYTVNFTTEEVTKVTTAPYGNDNTRNAGYDINSLAYDEATSTLYATEYTYDEELAASATYLYKVSTTDGSLTKVATLADQYLGLAAISGKLYLAKAVGSGWWNLDLGLYEVTDGTVATDAACSVATVKGLNASSKVSFATTDGKTYFQVGTSLFSLDFTEQTVALLGKTDKSLQGLTFTKSTENGSGTTGDDEEEEADTRLLVSTTRYGDAMGYVGADQDMSKELYFYDTNNKLSRMVEIGRGYTEAQTAGDYSVTYLTKYVYNEDGLLDSTARYQTGLYEFGDMAYKLRSTTSGYEYDEKGRITKEPTSSYTFLYEYDDKGNIVKTTKQSLAGKDIQILEYSDFIGKNKPKTIVSTCPQGWSSYIYDAVRTYDDNKNILSEVRSRDGVNYSKETYTYDGTFLTSKVESNIDGDVETPTSKTEYSMVDNDPNKIKRVDYNYYNGNWTGNATSHVDEYVDFADYAEYVGINDLTATIAADGINNVTLKFTAPSVAMTGCNFDIYRRGELIATKSVTDLVTEETDELTGMPILAYTDEALYNNDYEYFVQPTIAAFSDDLWGDDASTTYTGYNISNIADIKVALDLPTVKDLKQGVPYTDAEGTTYVPINWTNPEYPEEYGFISNDLHFLRYQTADATTTDATATTLDGKFDGLGEEVFILTRYKYGKVISDTLKVNLKVTEGIDAISKDGSFSLNGRELSLNSNATVAIYGMTGKLEAREANASSMNLNGLKPGAYIVCVTSEGKTSAYKVILK